MPSVEIPIAASGHDGNATGSGASYPPSVSFVGTTPTTVDLGRSLDVATFVIVNGLLRFDTSVIPDDATIDSATLRLWLTGKFDADNRSVCAGYYAVGTIGTEDYSATAETGAIAGVDITGLTANADNDFPLQNLGNINKTGFTELRLHVSGGQPAGYNIVPFATFDHATLPEPRLIVEYTEAAEGIQQRANVGTASGTSSSITVNKPTDAEEGDRIIVAISSHQTTTATPINAPDGSWTKLAEIEGEAGGGQTLAVFEKTAGASEPSSYTFTQQSATAEYASVALAVYHTDDLELAIYGLDSGEDTAGAAITTDSLSTLADDDLVISCYGQDQNATGDFVASSPAELVQVGEVWGASQFEGTAIFKETRATAGAGAHEVTVGAGDTARGACWAIFAVGIAARAPMQYLLRPALVM